MKKTLLFFTFFIITSASLPNLNAAAHMAEVENTSNRAYFNAALNAIQNAKDSITIIMYIISWNPKEKDQSVKELLDALVSAKNRGVRVKAILEYHSEKDFTPDGLSYNAFLYLKDNHIEIYFDKSSTRCMHAKAIVIDEEIVITGSSNWSIPAFTSSDEINILIRSKPLALEIIKCIEEIPVREDPGKGGNNTFSIPLPFCFSASGTLKRMVAANDERCLDIMLILWSENKNTISCDYLAERLGIAGQMDRNQYRRQIRKTLKKLEKKYELIRHKIYFAEDNIGIEFLNPVRNEQLIMFPKNYLIYSWDKRLPLCAKAVLITLYAEQQEFSSNIIRLYIISLSKKYGMKNCTYSEGIQILKQYNIIKVQYSPGQKDRLPAKITILGFYNMDEYNKKIDALARQYGDEKVSEAKSMAAIISAEYDSNIVEDILMKMNYYGIDNVKYAFNIIAQKRPDNYKRTYAYVLGILKRLPASPKFVIPRRDRGIQN